MCGWVGGWLYLVGFVVFLCELEDLGGLHTFRVGEGEGGLVEVQLHGHGGGLCSGWVGGLVLLPFLLLIIHDPQQRVQTAFSPSTHPSMDSIGWVGGGRGGRGRT